jgi:predicted DNA-binding transcriptional regulator YafY
MDGVKIIEEPCSEKAIALREQVAAYTEQAFKMFSGTQEDVVLEFDRGIIGAVYDKFGERVNMMPSGESRIVATVKVRISPTFWGWVFQFGRQMKILSPSHVVALYDQKLEEAK